MRRWVVRRRLVLRVVIGRGAVMMGVMIMMCRMVPGVMCVIICVTSKVGEMECKLGALVVMRLVANMDVTEASRQLQQKRRQGQ